MTDHPKPRIKITPAPGSGWRVFTTLPEDHAINTLVGRVAAKWSELELSLDRAIWRLAELGDQSGACMTTDIRGSGEKIAKILALCHHRKIDQKIVAQLEAPRAQIKKNQDRRNRIVHDAWYIEEPMEETHQFKSMAKSEPLFGLYPVAKEHLQKTLDTMQILLDETGNVLETIVAATRVA